MNRIWTYIIDKKLSAEDINAMQTEGMNFVNSWVSHEQKLFATFEIFKDRIIIIKLNEAVHKAGGCSLDTLAHFIKSLEKSFSVELLNRLLVAFKRDEEVEVVHSSKIKELLTQKYISENTIVFSTSMANSSELISWEQPLKKTWLCKYL